MNISSRKAGFPLIAVLAAHGLSSFGNMLTALAIPWFVLETTGSAARTGLTAATGGVAVVLTGMFGGAIVDRLGFRKTSFISDIASGLTLLAIPLIHLTVGISFWLLLVLVLLGALLDMPGVTARRSIFPEIAELAGMRLERANATYQIVNRLALLLGPPVAGILIALIGASNVLFVTTLAFAGSALLILAGVPRSLETQEHDEAGESGSYLQDILAGFRFIRDERTILWVISMLSIGGLIAEPLYSVILPVYGREVLGSALGLGFALAGLALGSIVGNLLYAWRGYELPRRLLIVGGFASRAVIFWLLVLQPGTWMLAVLMFLSGVLLEPVNPVCQTVMHERVPQKFRGRVFSASAAIAMASMPVGLIAYGFLLDAVGVHSTLVFMAVINLVLPVILYFNAAIRRIERAIPSTAPAIMSK